MDVTPLKFPVSVNGGFADNTPVVNSYVTMPDVPGVGFEAKAKLYAVMKQLADG